MCSNIQIKAQNIIAIVVKKKQELNVDLKLWCDTESNLNGLLTKNENSVIIYSNMYEFLSSVDHERRYFEECL